jgi:hypothetical protein
MFVQSEYYEFGSEYYEFRSEYSEYGGLGGNRFVTRWRFFRIIAETDIIRMISSRLIILTIMNHI